MKLSNLAGALIVIFGCVLALIFGKSLLFPFLAAMLIYFLIRSIHRSMDSIKILREKIPAWIKNLLSSIVIFSILGFTGKMLVVNAQHLLNSFGLYQANIDKILIRLNEFIGLDITKTISETARNFDLASVINPLLNSLTNLMGSVLMALFYLLFLFIEESNFRNKLHLIFPKEENYDEVRYLLNNIEHSITQYIGLKTMISFISSTVCFVIMLSFGIDSPLLWAFIIFIANFIPVIGAFLVALLPALFAMIQFGEINIPLLMFFALGTVQTLIGNVLEPKLMGDSLNISPLVALLSLTFWGAIWGIGGMIVSVPITVILIILLAHFEKTKSLAILLSQNGKV
ncbi:MAG: AI-2E family transporter [Flavobacteriia bacterium]|jgi:AI-2 transport protein TqsA